MRDVLKYLEDWQAHGQDIAIATVVQTWGSAPRPAGSKLLTTRDGSIAGSVSAGCVEGAVIEEALTTLETGYPKLLHFGVADDEAWEVGLACGGTIDVYVETFSTLAPVYPSLKKHLHEGIPVVVMSVLSGGDRAHHPKMLVFPDRSTEGSLSLQPYHERIIDIALYQLKLGESKLIELDDLTLFAEVYPPPPKLLIVGAVHIADPLVTMANAAGFETYVIDPRSAFATKERFPLATKLVGDWPQIAFASLGLDQWSYVVVLTHDPKLDDPALITALRSDARYVGALGSKRTNQKRIERLKKAGIMEEQIARLHAPIGIKLGGRAPAEIAVSIMAEVIRIKNEKPGDEAVA